MVDGKILVEKLIKYATTFLHLNKRDCIYTRNILLNEFKLDCPYDNEIDLSYIETLDVPDELVLDIENYALENNLINDGEQNLYSTYIMGIISPLPSKVNEEFMRIKNEQGIEKACEYFYNLSVKNNYVQKTAISKNIKWKYQDGDRYLEITINLSKPEKSNKDIAKLLTAPKTTAYPSCALCKENEGFEGTLTKPARENIRTVSLTLGGEPWFIQYSPYAYYNEHLIAINEEHTPMNINESTIDKILDFVDYLPNYMIGSNASLPLIGGSILNHEHFQGGGYTMPMHNAPIRTVMKSKKYASVKVGIVDWYNSVIRLESTDRQSVGNLAKDIINAWKVYSNENCFIFAETDGVKHNSLAPVCRKQGNFYIIDMILRNNITTEEYPEGYFHAHPEYHNIKREGIGLIEAMGLYILPGRLKKQLVEIAKILCGETKYNETELNSESHPLYVHRVMIKELYEKGLCDTFEQAEKVVKDRVNEVCKGILYNTAVFKNDENGQKGFKDFLAKVSIVD